MESDTWRNLLTSRTVNCIDIFFPALEDASRRNFNSSPSAMCRPRPAADKAYWTERAAASARATSRSSCGAGFLPLDRLADFTVSKDECQSGHEVQMRARGRAYDREQRMHWITIQGTVIDSLIEKAQCD